MRRREFLQVGLQGLGLVAAHSLVLPPLAGCTVMEPPLEPALGTALELHITEALVEMIDKTPVYHWLFAPRPGGIDFGPRFPGPVIFATAGEAIRIALTNDLDEDHAFEVAGVAGTASGPIPPGGTATVDFVVPVAGTYIYLDPLNAPLNRVLGLHGVLVVLPGGFDPAGPVNTPYTNPTPAVQRLFDDLGTAPQFPGDPWLAERTTVWLFHQIDPEVNARVQAGLPVDPARVRENFLPRYFTLNGRSGALAAHSDDTVLQGFVGEPRLVRIVNTGLVTHSPHIHANHVFPTSIDGVVQENVPSIDTWTVAPLDRIDWLVPFVRPPDIPGDPLVPLRQLLARELSLVVGGVPQSPLRYPMHGHNEPSQTAAGGNYPQGLVTDLVFLGDVDKVPFPNSHLGIGGPPHVPGSDDHDAH